MLNASRPTLSVLSHSTRYSRWASSVSGNTAALAGGSQVVRSSPLRLTTRRFRIGPGSPAVTDAVVVAERGWPAVRPALKALTAVTRTV